MSRELTELTRQFNQLKLAFDNLVKPEVGGWQDWTPAVAQPGSVTVTVTYARYITIAKSVLITAHLTVTGSGTSGNQIIISSLPFAPVHTDAYYSIGTGSVHDSGADVYVGNLMCVGADDLRIKINATGGNYIGADPSFALASGDEIFLTGQYERT